MKKLMKLLVISWLLVVFLLLPTAHYLLPTTQAQEGGIETTYTFEIKDGGAIDGDILISTDQGLIRANKSYDNKLFGILQTKPLMVYKSDNSTDLPVQRSGVARVNVVTSNGPISYGDFITSSTTPGKGQKASESGYVIGIALEPYNGQGEGKISVALRIEFNELSSPRTLNRIFSFVGVAFLENIKDPQKLGQIIRYITASLIILLSLGFSFTTFYKSVLKSTEALGRNPLAKNMIFRSLIISIVLVIITTLIGIGAAVLIINL